MKFSLFIIFELLVFFLFSCKEVSYWNPNFELTSIQSEKKVSLKTIDQLSPEVQYLVINFFAPNCPPCIEELPFLKYFEEILPKYPHIKFISAGSLLESLDTSQEIPEDISTLKTVKKKLLSFKKEHNMLGDIYFASAKNFKDFLITGFPETIILEKKKTGWSFKRKFISVLKKEELFSVIGLQQ